MKKLNRKGFTLVELLAVIVILAIVVGIAFPLINNIINESKNKALEDVVKITSNYLTNQYALLSGYSTTVDADFVTAFGSSPTDEVELTENLMVAAGLDTKNVTSVKAKLNTTSGKICVTIASIPTKSDYYVTDYWVAGENDTATPKANSGVKNTNCS